MRSIAPVLAALAVAALPAAARAADWTTYGGDAAHTNFNPLEHGLGPSQAKHLRIAWSAKLDGVIDTQPTYAARVKLGKRRRNLVFAATEHGGVFAVDAGSGRIVWRRPLANRHVPCWQNTPDSRFGVSAAPVIDRGRGRLYVVAADNAVHALSMSTGKDAPGWPLTLGLPPAAYHVWGSPTLAGNRLYVPVASYCDTGNYRGGVTLADVASRRVTRRWYAVGPALNGGAVWQWGGAPVDLADGSVYVATGNAVGGPEDADYAEHVVRLSRELNLVDSHDPAVGPRHDADFASAPLLFQPHGCPGLLAVIHKNATLFVYRRDALGAGPIQRVDLGTPGFYGVSGTFAWAGGRLYVTTDNQTLHGLLAFRISGCRLVEVWRRGVHRQMWWPSAPTVANGVAYFGTGHDGELVAVNTKTGKLLWRSGQRIARPIYAAPTVIGGHVFVGAWDRRLYRFDGR